MEYAFLKHTVASQLLQSEIPSICQHFANQGCQTSLFRIRFHFLFLTNSTIIIIYLSHPSIKILHVLKVDSSNYKTKHGIEF